MIRPITLIFKPWSDEALKRGFRSLMAVPITTGKRVYGALAVYSDRVDVFDDEEVALMEDVADDIAFAMTVIEAEAERKRSEEALKESEEKFRSFFETSRDIVFITSPDGTVLDVNKAFEDILGYTREETLPKNVTHFYKNQDDRNRFRKAVENLGFVRDFEVAVRRKDGTFVDCLITATVKKGSRRRDHRLPGDDQGHQRKKTYGTPAHPGREAFVARRNPFRGSP